MRQLLGMIGGLETHNTLSIERAESITVETPYGQVQATLRTINDTMLVQLARSPKGTAAHAINHKANSAAFLKLGVNRVIATSMVGALHTSLSVGSLLLLDQFLDFTKHTQWMLHEDDQFRDFDFTEPFCPSLRSSLLSVAQTKNIDLIPHACYVGVDGPRFETRAEVQMYARLGGDVIGMTVVPECIIAREAGLCYSAIAGVVNPGAGISARPLLAKEFLEARSFQMEKMIELIIGLAQITVHANETLCSCTASS